MSSRRRKWLIAVLAAGLAAAGVAGWWWCEQSQQRRQEKELTGFGLSFWQHFRDRATAGTPFLAPPVLLPQTPMPEVRPPFTAEIRQNLVTVKDGQREIFRFERGEKAWSCRLLDPELDIGQLFPVLRWGELRIDFTAPLLTVPGEFTVDEKEMLLIVRCSDPNFRLLSGSEELRLPDANWRRRATVLQSLRTDRERYQAVLHDCTAEIDAPNLSDDARAERRRLADALRAALRQVAAETGEAENALAEARKQAEQTAFVDYGPIRIVRKEAP